MKIETQCFLAFLVLISIAACATAGSDTRSVELDPDPVKRGARLYQPRCTECHGSQGQGGTGPSLVQSNRVARSTQAELVKWIAEGSVDKGMPQWGSRMKPQDLDAVALFVKSLLPPVEVRPKSR
jgi:cytochrome c oxidase cbb3-type subunit 3